MRYLQRALLGLLAVCLVAAGYLWLTLLSPWGYHPPEDLPAIEATMDGERGHQVFAYGTLTRPWVRRIVMGRAGPARPDALAGYRRDALDVIPDATGRTVGQVFEVSRRELARLDRYERLGIRYERELKSLESGELAWVYRRLAGDDGE